MPPRRRPSASIFEEANVKLSSVITDILGVSGRRIFRAIVAGETDPAKLSELGGPRLAATPAHLAIRGSMAPARSEPQGLTPSVTPWSQWTSRICFSLKRSGCARCPLASPEPEPRHDAGQVTHSTVRPAHSIPAPRCPHPQQPQGRDQITIDPLHRCCSTSRDFVHWRFSYACGQRAWMASSCRHPKTYTGPDLSLCGILVG